ncbi:hypothetical protein [Chryseolinea lacunae]|uniref:Bacteriocin n=1 Tax=Chryseolinea lacunae TaxID=2801331 RepID=A0ABS1KKU8_9BACT|nr:hypothetical protein [Chryseolinea lacunae]MBL0739954.1 hypothetical protein [Chryseolinea lacunae]
MKRLSDQTMKAVNGGGNCSGSYNACIVGAAVTGAAVAALTAGWGAYFGVAIAASGMEYCRQQAIGCYQDASYQAPTRQISPGDL